MTQNIMKTRDLALIFGGGVAAAVAVKLLIRPSVTDWDAVAESVPHSNHSKFISVDSARVHYQEFGESTAPLIILIHGYTASVYVWKTTAPLLAAAGFRVIAIDLLGFGYSEKPSGFDYTIESQARMISRFMDRLSIGRAIVVGSSYGGAVAATIALDYPGRVEKLVLVDAVINDDAKNHPVLRLASIPALGEVITPFLADSKTFLKFRMQNTLARANHHLINEERIVNVIRPMNAADAHHAVLATARNWHAKRIEKDAHLIDHQTLIIWGEQDTVIPIVNGYKLYNSVLQSRLIVMKDCGHVPQEEKSDLFADLVVEFCKDPKGQVRSENSDGLVISS